MAQDVDWENAIAWPDDRFEYEEIRMNAIVPMGNRFYFVTYVEHEEKLHPISLRLDVDVLETLKATGRGWQTRANDALREWLKTRVA